MISILFVDDEINILEGIRNSLRRKRDVWHMEFAQSGEEALNCLAASQFDIIVSDMRMPGMDGAVLLGKVQETYPEIIRFILTGHADRESVLRAIPFTHQFLHKPINPTDLIQFLDRVALFIENIKSEKVRDLVTRIKSIPSRPKTAIRLSATLARHETSLEQFKNVIEHDPGLAARFIQVSNCAFCGHSREVVDVADAISLIGIEFAQELALATEDLEITSNNRHLIEHIETIYDEALYGSALVSKFLKGNPNSGFASTVTLLRDIGLIITASVSQSVCDLSILGTHENDEIQNQFVFKVFGLTHAEVGGHLLAIWGLPMQIVDAVTCHQTMELSTIDPLIMSAVHVADVASSHQGKPFELWHQFIDWEYLDKHGLRNQVHDWIETAVEKQDAA